MGKNTTNDMTQGNCMRLLVQFFLPILAGNLFQQLYSFADSMWWEKELAIRHLQQSEIPVPYIF